MSRMNIVSMKKRIIALPVLLSCVFGYCGCNNVAEKAPIKIGINIWPGYAHAFIAREKGLFEKNRVDVELVFKRDISEITRMYRNEELDGFFGVFADVLMIDSEGTHTQVVYISDYSDTGDVIIGRADVSSLSDLNDRIVSFDGINTFSHIFVIYALENAGVKETKVRFEDIHAMDVLNALEEGKIDAGHTWEPIITQALKRGYKILTRAGDTPGLITDVLAFRKEIVQSRPADIQKIVKSLLEARNSIYTDKEEAIQIMAEAEGMSVEEMESGLDGIQQPDLNENIAGMTMNKEALSLYRSGEIISDFYLKRGQLIQMPDLNDIIKPIFLQNIKASVVNEK